MSAEIINELSIKILELLIEDGEGKLDRSIGPKYYRKYRETVPNELLQEKGYINIQDFVVQELSSVLILEENNKTIEFQTTTETKKDVFRRKVLMNKAEKERREVDSSSPTKRVTQESPKSGSYESPPALQHALSEPIEEYLCQDDENGVPLEETIELQSLYNEFTDKVPFRFLTKDTSFVQRQIKEWSHTFETFTSTKWSLGGAEKEKVLYKLNTLTPPIETGKLKFDNVDVAISAVYSVDSFFVQVK